MAKFGAVDGGGLRCSFCGKPAQQVKKLIAGPSVYICDECVEICNDILLEEGHVAIHHTSGDALAVPRHELTSVVRTLDQAVGAIGLTNAAVADDAARLAGRLHRRLQTRPPEDEDEPPDPSAAGDEPAEN